MMMPILKTALKGVLPAVLLMVLLHLVFGPETLAGQSKATAPSLGATVDSLGFYQSAQGFPPKDQRHYTFLFDKSMARYINWELNLSYPTAARDTNFRIEWTIEHKQNGSHARFGTDTYLKEGWNSSNHSDGYGWPEAGKWEVGDYEVELFVDGSKVASGMFSVQETRGGHIHAGEPEAGQDSEDDLGEL